jgi:hypothetical protein
MVFPHSSNGYDGLIMSDKIPILILCRDLLFASKITATAQATATPFKLVRDASKLDDEPDARRLIVDLTQQGFIEAAAGWKQRTGGHVTGFAGHADVETIAQAQAAGLDTILARGQFAATLPEILKSAASTP